MQLTKSMRTSHWPAAAVWWFSWRHDSTGPMLVSNLSRYVISDTYDTIPVLRRDLGRTTTQHHSRRQFRDGLKSHLFADAYFWSSESIHYKSVMYLLTYLLSTYLLTYHICITVNDKKTTEAIKIRQEGQDITNRDEGSSCCPTSTTTCYSLRLQL